MTKQRVFLCSTIMLQMVLVFGLIFIGREVLAQDDDTVMERSALVDGNMVITNQQILRDMGGDDMSMLPIAYGYVEANSDFRGTPNVTVSTFGPGGYTISIDDVDCGDFALIAHCVVSLTAVGGAPTDVYALGGDITVHTYAGPVPANNAFQFVVYGL